MICTVCGGPQPCAHSPQGVSVVSPDRFEEDSTKQTLDAFAVAAQSRADQRTWREEVTLRVKGHRARHRRSDTASLELNFPDEEPPPVAAPSLARLRATLSVSDHDALTARPEVSIAQELSARPSVHVASDLAQETLRRRPRKIIRFPKYPTVDTAPHTPLITEMELAEPVVESPRILDAPPAEQMELLPSFAGLHLEDVGPANPSLHDLDLPPRPAPLNQRLAAGLVDAAVVVSALALFCATFFKLAETALPFRLAMITLLGAGLLLWSVFQFLFLVYGRQTPGMRATHIELFAFQGEPAPVKARRVRVLALGLSAISVGLGFAWTLIDEDTLGWHDRISQTYLKLVPVAGVGAGSALDNAN